MDENGRGRGFRDILLWLLVLVVPLLLMVLILPSSLTGSDSDLPISQVAAAVQRGTVRGLTIQGDTVIVQFADGTIARSRKESGVSLVDTLRAEGVTPQQLAGVTVAVAAPSFWSSLGSFIWVVPLIIILGVILLMSRQTPVQSGGDQTLAFSRAGLGRSWPIVRGSASMMRQ